MKTQPFVLPKEWALHGLPSIHEHVPVHEEHVEFGRSESTMALERAINEVKEKLTPELVISVIAYYVRRQELWWQGSTEIELDSPIEKRFHDLAEKWRKETKHISSLTKILLHPAYQRIIGMGPVAIKFILRELERRPYHWFWALESITGENPVHSEDDFDNAVKAWLQWGRQHGFI